MASGLISRKWLMRLGYAAICLALLFLQLLPLETTPRRWAGPDLLVVVTLVWAIRQPKFTPPLLVGLVFLLANLLLLRPPGLMAAVMVLAVEILTGRARSLRAATFATEWITAAAATITIMVAYRLGLMLFFVERASLGLTLMQVIMNIVIYPAIVLLSSALFGVRRAPARETGMRTTS